LSSVKASKARTFFDAGGDHDGPAQKGSAKGVVESADDFSAGPQNPTFAGLLAETEGFEPSIELYNPITV
jgi:hypothetical protein